MMIALCLPMTCKKNKCLKLTIIFTYIFPENTSDKDKSVSKHSDLLLQTCSQNIKNALEPTKKRKEKDNVTLLTAVKHQDVIGILMKVRQVNRFERKDKLSFGYRREVILINTMLQTITINLWDDLALNEGQLLKENCIKNSIVSFCNLKMSTYHVAVNIYNGNAAKPKM
ncbi:uncharacterized protein LOC142532858 [Primulina tabacum]|uniref:uncharacterized protein LOC142532858 n=1 Tax=Primulina tabacum TaxID=48773 RepID=UPI003F5ADCC8